MEYCKLTDYHPNMDSDNHMELIDIGIPPSMVKVFYPKVVPLSYRISSKEGEVTLTIKGISKYYYTSMYERFNNVLYSGGYFDYDHEGLYHYYRGRYHNIIMDYNGVIRFEEISDEVEDNWQKYNAEDWDSQPARIIPASFDRLIEDNHDNNVQYNYDENIQFIENPHPRFNNLYSITVFIIMLYVIWIAISWYNREKTKISEEKISLYNKNFS
jgi:hypothetical protein